MLVQFSDPEQRPTATDLLDHDFLIEDPSFNFKKAVERAAIMRKMRRHEDDDDVSTIGGRTLSYTQLHTMREALDEPEQEEPDTLTEEGNYHMTIDEDGMIHHNDDDAVVPTGTMYVENETMLKLNGLSQGPSRGWS